MGVKMYVCCRYICVIMMSYLKVRGRESGSGQRGTEV